MSTEYRLTWTGELLKRLEAEKLQARDMVVLNPNNGPAYINAEQDIVADAARFIRRKLAQPMGYVHLTYGDRPIGAVVGDISEWGIIGIYDIFYDESSWTWDYATLRRFTSLQVQPKESNEIRTVFNMGAIPAETRQPFRSLIVAYEGKGAPVPGKRPVWHAALAYASSPLNSYDWAWGYATSDDIPNPWDGIPVSS